MSQIPVCIAPAQTLSPQHVNHDRAHAQPRDAGQSCATWQAASFIPTPDITCRRANIKDELQ
jgi:hypothetical protein